MAIHSRSFSLDEARPLLGGSDFSAEDPRFDCCSSNCLLLSNERPLLPYSLTDAPSCVYRCTRVEVDLKVCRRTASPKNTTSTRHLSIRIFRGVFFFAAEKHCCCTSSAHTGTSVASARTFLNSWQLGQHAWAVRVGVFHSTNKEYFPAYGYQSWGSGMISGKKTRRTTINQPIVFKYTKI